MKNSNRFAVKISAIVLAFVMLFSLAVPALAAKVDVASTKYYTISYDSSTGTPQLVVTLNANEFGQFVADRKLTKNELMKFLPDIFADALVNKTLPSLQDLISLIPAEMLSYDEITKLVPADLFKKFLTAEKLGELLTPGAVDTLFTDTLLNDIANNVDLSTLLNASEIATIEGWLSNDDLLALGADPTDAEVIEYVKTNYNAKLVDLLKTKVTDIVSAVGVTAMITKLGGFEKIVKVIDKDQLVSFVKNMLSQLMLNDLDTLTVSTNTNGTDLSVPAVQYNATNFCFDLALNDLADVIAQSVPSVDTLNDLKDGDTVYNLAFQMTFATTSNTAGLGITFKVAGDTSIVNQYADKIFDLLGYQINNDLDLSFEVDDSATDAFITFAKVMNKVLATSRLTDAEKVTLLSLYTKSGSDLINALKDLDFNSFTFLDADQISALTKVRDKSVEIFQAAMNRLPAKYADMTIDSLYQGNGQFAFSEDASIKTDAIINKLATFLGVSANDFDTFFDYDEVISGALSFNINMADVYRVRYYDANNTLLYTTYLPVDADLALLSDNVAALAGLAPDGWVNASGTVITNMTAGDLDLYTAAIAQTYTATFVADGKVVATVDFVTGTTTITEPAVPAKTGYTGAWEDYVLADADITINAIYTANDYTIVFRPNGGSGSMDDLTTAYDVAVNLTKNAFTREDYKFLCWNTQADGSGTNYVDGAEVKYLALSGNFYLYAQWRTTKPGVYLATFVADGKIVGTVEFPAGTTSIEAPEVPAKAGYTGVWEDYTLNDTDLYIYAEYTANSYKVNFDANGGTGEMASLDAIYDDYFALPANTFAYAGKVFNGWNTKADGTGLAFANLAVVSNLAESGEITLYAQWMDKAVVIETYTATFKVDGKVIASVTFQTGATSIKEPTVAAKLGYTFAWDAYTLGNADITINGTYTANSYKINFNANGGNGSMNAVNATYDASVTLPQNTFTRDGYVFAGWNTQANGHGIQTYGDKASVKNLATSGEVTLYAQWTKASVATYTAIFEADGVVVASVPFTAGTTSIEAPAVPAKTGYSGKWENYTLSNANITIKAVYTANTYKINFNANEGTGSMSALTATYDKDVALTANAFTRDGYTFKGWATKADAGYAAYADKATVKNLAASGEVTLYAQWEKNAPTAAVTYTVTFRANGVLVDIVTYAAGATSITEPTVPAKIGYAGAWESYSLANADITVNAVYTANSYKINFNANGGEGTLNAVDATYDASVTLPANAFTREGYEFKCWNTQADGTGHTYSAEAVVTNLVESGEITLYAIWTEEAAASNAWIIWVIVAVVVLGAAVAVFFILKSKGIITFGAAAGAAGATAAASDNQDAEKPAEDAEKPADKE